MDMIIFPPNARNKATAEHLPINFTNGYALESTQKFADEMRVALIELFVYGSLPVNVLLPT